MTSPSIRLAVPTCTTKKHKVQAAANFAHPAGSDSQTYSHFAHSSSWQEPELLPSGKINSLRCGNPPALFRCKFEAFRAGEKVRGIVVGV